MQGLLHQSLLAGLLATQCCAGNTIVTPSLSLKEACRLVAKLHVMSEGFLVSSVPICIPCPVSSCNVADHVTLGFTVKGYTDFLLHGTC